MTVVPAGRGAVMAAGDPWTGCGGGVVGSGPMSTLEFLGAELRRARRDVG
ncbi:hypothetical protein [Micromonospora sp. KC723]|nr:hypothetical protein [Micromonospora sp. KC723]